MLCRTVCKPSPPARLSRNCLLWSPPPAGTTTYRVRQPGKTQHMEALKFQTEFSDTLPPECPKRAGYSVPRQSGWKLEILCPPRSGEAIQHQEKIYRIAGYGIRVFSLCSAWRKSRIRTYRPCLKKQHEFTKSVRPSAENSPDGCFFAADNINRRTSDLFLLPWNIYNTVRRQIENQDRK